MTIELGDRTIELTEKKLLVGSGAVVGLLLLICSAVFVGRLLLASGASARPQGASEDGAPTPTPTAAEAPPTATSQTQPPMHPKASGDVGETATPEPRVVVEAYMLNVRADAGADAEIVGGVEQDDSLVVLDEHGEWLQVETPDGTVGWVYGEYVTDIVVGTGAQ